MVQMNIALGIADVRYGTRLYEYLTERNKDELRLWFCRDPEEMGKEENLKDFQAILAEEEFLKRLKSKNDPALKILLHEGTAPKEFKDQPSIEKYSSAERILQQIYAYLGEKGPADRIHLNGKRLIGVFSPAGTKNQELFSKALAGELAGNNEVLYLSFMDFPGTGTETVENVSDLSELLYYSRKGEDHFLTRVRAAVLREDSYYVLKNANNPENLHEFDAGEYDRFFGTLSENTAYDVIIVDFGFLLPEFTSLMQRFTVLFALTEGDAFSERCNRKFKEYYSSGSNEKLSWVTLPAASGMQMTEQISDLMRENGLISKIIGEEKRSG